MASAYSIEPDQLRTSDILVTTGRAFVSKVIRKGTGTDYSHTVLYVGDGNVVEAIDQGVVERSLTKALDETTLAVVLRRRFMTAQTKQLVAIFARNFALAKIPYDYTGAAGAGLSHKRGKLAAAMSPRAGLSLYIAAKLNARDSKKDKKFFCSELAARCFQLAGVPINDGDPSFTTPRSVRVAANLMYMEHLIGGPGRKGPGL